MTTSQQRQLLIQKAKHHFNKTDPKLADIMDRVELPFSVIRHSHLEELIQIIIAQQLSGKAAKTIANKVRQLCPEKKINLDSLIDIKDVQLREAGMSHAKIKAVRDLIAHVEDGRFNFRRFNRMADTTIIDAITQVKGLGPWSAQMYLMFVLLRPDVFSPGDLGIRTAIGRLYNLDTQEIDIEEFSNRWKPYRTVACWYLWAYLGSNLI